MVDHSHRPKDDTSSSYAPFQHAAFTVLWVATVVSNIGVWMFNAAASWLMTLLGANAFLVAMVQVASTVPMFMFAIPAGALADILNRRRFLIGVQIVSTFVATVAWIFVYRNWMTPSLLLTFTFLAGFCGALVAPAWQAVVPQLVPRSILPAAITLNGAGINMSRAVGPALAGILIGAYGMPFPFAVNALSFLVIIAALIWWRMPEAATPVTLPSERFVRAVGAGLRHARYNEHLRSTLYRAAAVFPFTAAYWALLPLVARDQIGGGSSIYGILLGTVGAGALLGALALAPLRARFSTDAIFASGSVGTAIALALLGLAREPYVALAGSLIAGLSWISLLSSLNVSTQLALPDWVRARGLAIFVTTMFGSMSLGSVAWGQLAVRVGVPLTLLVAAAGLLLFLVVTWRWKLQTGAELDFSPSMHWPDPVLAVDLGIRKGPVMVTAEYHVRPDARASFLECIAELGNERRRDGAFAWHIVEDAANTNRFVEVFLLDDWTEHLRQHARVTNADRDVQVRLSKLVETPTEIRHFLSTELDV